jgi:hypothetical protein
MKCAVAPKNDTMLGVAHASAVSDTRPKDFCEMSRNQQQNVGTPGNSAHFHLMMKLFLLRFPHFNNHLCQTCPFGDIVIGNETLAEVQEKLAKVRTFDYIDRLYD